MAIKIQRGMWSNYVNLIIGFPFLVLYNNFDTVKKTVEPTKLFYIILTNDIYSMKNDKRLDTSYKQINTKKSFKNMIF